MTNSKSQLLLIGESFSPWTKKARWALEQCGVVYDYQEYIPTLSEPGLRWRLRQLGGSVSVPIAFIENRVLRGSWQIASYANDQTRHKQTDEGLLGDFKEIEVWNDLSEAGLAEGRTGVVRRIHDNQQALQESLPAFVPKFLRPSLRFIARDAVKRLDRKYAHLYKKGALEEALVETRKKLEESDSDYLLGRFSYADITMAAVIEIFSTLAKSDPPLGPATQSCWNDSFLEEKYEDLIAWRNRLAETDATSYSQFE